MQVYGSAVSVDRIQSSVPLVRLDERRGAIAIAPTPPALAPAPTRVASASFSRSYSHSHSHSLGVALTGFLSATAVIASSMALAADAVILPEPETLSNIPQTLSGECTSPKTEAKDCNKAKIQRPKSRKAESCTIRCVTTCIRGGQGSPGEGPLNVRRPLVVFKQGFRTRQYCLVECSDICNLISDGDDGP